MRCEGLAVSAMPRRSTGTTPSATMSLQQLSHEPLSDMGVDSMCPGARRAIKHWNEHSGRLELDPNAMGVVLFNFGNVCAEEQVNPNTQQTNNSLSNLLSCGFAEGNRTSSVLPSTSKRPRTSRHALHSHTGTSLTPNNVWHVSIAVSVLPCWTLPCRQGPIRSLGQS